MKKVTPVCEAGASVYFEHISSFILFNFSTEIEFKMWRVTFLKSFLPQRKYGIVFRFSENNGTIECTLRLDEL